MTLLSISHSGLKNLSSQESDHVNQRNTGNVAAMDEANKCHNIEESVEDAGLEKSEAESRHEANGCDSDSLPSVGATPDHSEMVKRMLEEQLKKLLVEQPLLIPTLVRLNIKHKRYTVEFFFICS